VGEEGPQGNMKWRHCGVDGRHEESDKQQIKAVELTVA
jgi:hypothetical protein